jgi:proteasome assembly chaperone (PAC2) family protein
LREPKSFKLLSKRKFDGSTLIVVWSQDVARLGPKIADYLSSQLKYRPLAEIGPEGFFSLGGVTVEGDVAQFPESKFYCCRKNDVVIFRSDIPKLNWYEFINLLLDVAQKHFKVKQIFTIGGMVLPGAHTAPRTLLSVVNSLEMKRILGNHDIVHDMDYETRDDQRPTFSSYLIWVARMRNIPAACLWVPVPFYLMTAEDPEACKKVLGVLNTRLQLHLNFRNLDNEMLEQNQKIARARREFPELDEYISKLESNLGLTAEEGEKLVKEMDELLRGQHSKSEANND